MVIQVPSIDVQVLAMGLSDVVLSAEESSWGIVVGSTEENACTGHG